MSGVAGADRVKSRLDFKQFLSSYQHLLGQFPGFVSMTPSGSYNSNPDKQDFGDIDLIVHIQSDKDKATLKKELQAFFMKQPETVIVPFSSAKHAGKRTYNAGELVSVRYHDDALGYSAQIDNIVALDHLEASFKQAFLDMPAEEQGLVLGLVKIATIETDPAILFQKLGINVPTQLEPDQEYEFNLSGVELQLRKVTYEPGTYKQLSRDIVWNSKNFDDLQKLLFQYDLKAGFESLLQQSKQNIRNPRSNARMQGVFSSMISVKSGEVGTPKGAGKEAALAKVQQAFGESRNKSLFRSLMENNNRKIVFAFGRFQPPTIGHELLINTVKQTAEHAGAAHAIYVSKTQDHKTNPLAVDQKIAYLRKMFPGTTFVAADATVRTPIEAAKHLNQTYNELIMVAGSDRAPSFENLLNTYNGKDFNYQTIQVVSSGERDPDSDEVSGMSGTKMREAAVANDFQTFRQGLPSSLSDDDAMNLMNLVRTGLTKPVKVKEEAGSQLSIQQLASVSDEALDNAYHYGRSTPGNSFGWQANLKSAEYAKQMIDSGVTDIEKISDAIHKGWNVTAQAFVQNPDQFDDTAKLKAAGKLEAKLQQRAQLMKQNYAQLPDDEKEKDRVVARALLQAIRGTQGVAEAFSQAAADKNKIKYQKAGRIGHGVGWKEYGDDYSSLVSDIVNKFDNITRLVQYDQAEESTKYKIVERFFKKYGYPFELFNDVITAIERRVAGETNRYNEQGVAEAGSKAVANTASRLANKDDGKVAKLRAAGDKKRDSQYMGTQIAKNDRTSKDEWGNLKEAVDPESDVYLESVIAELSNEKLGQYKKAAAADASSADKAGDYERGNKRFSGIVKATKKQFANDEKKVAEKMLPKSAFAGSDKNKLGSAGQLTGSMKRPAKAGDLVGSMEEAKKKGADGKACWDSYRYNGTKNGKDSCVKVSEDIESIMESFINKIIVNEAIQNNKR